MAIQSFQLDPGHTHTYRKVTRLGADSDDKFLSPTWTDIVDDSDNNAAESVDLEAVGITVATSSTSTPE